MQGTIMVKRKHPHENNFVRRVENVLLFVRGTNESELSKLANGERIKVGILRKQQYSRTSIGGMLELGDLKKVYGLEKEFNFDLPFYEYIIHERFFEEFQKFLEKTLKSNPEISFEEFSRLKFTPLHSPTKKKPGRRPQTQTAELIKGFNEENLTHRQNAEKQAEKTKLEIVQNRMKNGDSEEDAKSWADKTINEAWIEKMMKKSKDAVSNAKKKQITRTNKVAEKSNM